MASGYRRLPARRASASAPTSSPPHGPARSRETGGLKAPSDWLERCRGDAAKWTAHHREQLAATVYNAALSPLAVLDELSRYGGEITLVADTGYMAAWTGVLFPTVRYDAFFRAVGSLGWALPASLGGHFRRRACRGLWMP